LSPVSILKTLIVNTLISIALFAVIDLVVSNSSVRFMLIPDSFRIPDRRLHHTLEKNVSSGLAVWGDRHYRIYTNSLGFKDSAAREIKPVSDKPVRVLFIGDSFTEGVGLPWDQTFVGVFASRFPEVEVLNGGVVGYSPSIYLRQVELLLSRGLTINDVIIYIDISDVQDEALCKFDSLGDIVDTGFVVNPLARVGDPPDTIQWRSAPTPTFQVPWERSLWPEFELTRYLDRQIDLLFSGSRRAKDPDRLVKSMWTVEGVTLPYGYGNLGVTGAIEKELGNMNELAQILHHRGIKFSLAVYPWPDQMQYDIVESKQVTIWRSWCERNACENFINHFPDFFALKNRADWRKLVYLPGDVHFNQLGNRMIAERLSVEMAPMLAPQH
jgi:hypothetical protein